jgi:hypothetical protein
MTKENYKTSAIDQFLSNLRIYNTSIGDYEQHTLLDDTYTYSIKLTNGNIRIYREELQDKTIIPHERLKEIAMRFNERK